MHPSREANDLSGVLLRATIGLSARPEQLPPEAIIPAYPQNSVGSKSVARITQSTLKILLLWRKCLDIYYKVRLNIVK